jgi:hypothetical protein
MIEFFFDIQLNGSEKVRLMALKEYIVSPAEMGKIMFENFNDYANVIVELERISQTTCTKKTKPSKPIEKKMVVEENFITLTNESPIMDTVEKYNSLMKPPSTYEPVNKNEPGMMQWNMEPYLPTSGSAFAQYV